MRQRIHDMRGAFARGMKERTEARDFSFIEQQRGMFSFSGLGTKQVKALREKYAIYIVDGGRINVAGLTSTNLEYFCESVAAVL